MNSVRAAGRPLRRRLLQVDQLMTWTETWAEMRRHPVLLYSMGRTGTTSLTDAIEQQTDRTILKAHSLVFHRIARRIALERRCDPRPRFWWRSQAMAAYLRTHSPPAHGRWQVISVVRDPVARAVSAYFYGEPWRRARRPLTLVELTSGVEAMLRRIALEEDWFREELQPVTNINVYAHHFDPDAGWQRCASDRFDAVVIRTEDVRRAGSEMLQALLGRIGPLEVPSSNRGPANEQSPYRQFLAEWRPDPSLIEAVYQTSLVRHFYAPEEIEQMRDHWLAAGTS